MAVGSRVGGDGGNGDEGEPAGGWRAEEAVGGYRMALQALRELVVYPFLYAREARLLGLKVVPLVCLCPLLSPARHQFQHPARLRLTNFCSVCCASLYSSVAQRIAVLRPPWHRKARLLCISLMLERAKSSCVKLSLKRTLRHHGVGQPSFSSMNWMLYVRDVTVGQDYSLMESCSIETISRPMMCRVDAIDPALRRPGRFDSEIEVYVPTVKERLQILKLHAKNLHLHESVDLQTIAGYCNGYTGANLKGLCREATLVAYRRLSNSSGDEKMLTLLMENWESARSQVKASMIGASSVSWDDIGGLKDLKKKLQQAVEWPIKHAAAFARLGISPVRGVLLHGPPGCSKTTLAKAAAHASQASFFSLSGAELYSKYVGEGDALLRRTFQRARLSAPSIIFFDEADAIAPKRTGSDGDGNATVGESLLSTLLTEMDGLELATGIIVLAATNRLKAIDAALLRPGRFDMVLYVPPPDAQGRHEILRIKTRKMRLGEDVDIGNIAERTELFTGADLEGLCREAGMLALREDLTASSIDKAHFEAAVRSLKPSLTKAELTSTQLLPSMVHQR
ncbi:hypothetical protein ACQ4PT_015923 [Festuca glaucescens]